MTTAFTGTRQGMTILQKAEVNVLAHNLKPSTVHHGCCTGGDRDFHTIMEPLHPAFHLWPSDHEQANWAWDQHSKEQQYMLIHGILPPLERNDLMAQFCQVLIATPAQQFEILRSGTWATIRYARKYKKRVVIVYPDGTVEDKDYACT